MILGISAYYHDASACIVNTNGQIIAAAQEERFSRKKNDASFPKRAIEYCLAQAQVTLSEIDLIVYYEKPLLKFERLLETWLAFAPRGFSQFFISAPVWAKEKLFLRSTLLKALKEVGGGRALAAKLVFADHHLSHAASAFYPSPFSESAILTIDGVGEWTTTSIFQGSGSEIESLVEIHFPHSLGFLYSAMTQYLGFKVNSGEYKVMGLAPYGIPRYVNQIRENLIEFNYDGSFYLNLDFFDFCTGRQMIKRNRWEELFGGPQRVPDTELTPKDADLAASIQEVIQNAVLNLAKRAKSLTRSDNLCLAGGVALNCVSNTRVLKQSLFDRIWVQPAAGDAGGSVGAALLGSMSIMKSKDNKVVPKNHEDSVKALNSGSMNYAYLGPEYSDLEIERELLASGLRYTQVPEEFLTREAAFALSSGQILGWFQGRMEFGPRSLGNRSILADPRNPEMQVNLNLRIKFRETFRPFAPSVLAEHLEDWFELRNYDHYMLFINYFKESRRKLKTHESLVKIGAKNYSPSTLRDILKEKRSEVPAVTHLDYSARTQIVTKEANPKFHKLISRFHEITGIPMIINTSFNVRGEPIVCSPRDAIECFLATDIDALYISNYVIKKSEQEDLRKSTPSRRFALD